MTDKQIACAYLSARLRGIIPDYDELRGVADAKLTAERCSRITERIIAMTEKMSEPLVQYLNGSGVDVT